MIETTELQPIDILEPGDPTSGEPEVDAANGGGRTMATLGAAASSAAAAWMVAGLFKGFSAHVISLLGVAIGAGLVLLAGRGGRYAVAQYLVAPVSLVAGAALIAPETRAGTATVGGLVVDAVRHGGFLQPPVSFDPGWRLLLVVLFALVAAGAAGVAVGLGKPKLGVALPGPLIMGGAILQPKGSELASAAVALVLTVIGLTLAFGVELGRDGRLSAAFELPRLIRAGGIAVALAVGVVAVNAVGFLFPQPNTQHVVPPQRPHTPPAQPDRVLFTVQEPRAIPLRVGVLDTYDPAKHAWLLPGYDASKLRHLKTPAKVPGAPPAIPDVPAVGVSVTVERASGHALPSIAGLQSVSGMHDAVDYDPSSQSLALADKPVFQGLTYTLTGAAFDRLTRAQLVAAGAPDHSLDPYKAAPSPPNEVVALLGSCADRASKLGVPDDAFDRLQCVRQGLYDKVVAAGAGTPVDLPVTRVVQMLTGGDASPYEITAAEALLARWAGVPSRIGYGYYGGDVQKDGSYQVRPRHGAMWIETYFGGYGWVPIIGVPPKAKPSTSLQQKNPANIAAVNRIQMMIYIPIRHQSVTLLFVYVRYYLARVGLPALLLFLLAFAYPWFFKLVRTRRRRRWREANGLPGRVAVAYAEFRDRARDLAIGEPAATPLRFLRFIEADTEHRELAWLVTRALWGDLRRDLTPDDAAAAERMAASVTRRLDRAQPILSRVLARIARTSLRQPYSVQVPNVWYEFRPGRGRRGGGALRSLRPHRGRRTAIAAAAVLFMLLSACGRQAAAPPRVLSDRLVPDRLGSFEFRPEPGGEDEFKKAGPEALVSAGRMYSVHHGDSTDGSVEVALFKADVSIEDINDESKSGECAVHVERCPGHEVLKGFQANLGSGHFHRLYDRGQRAYVMSLPDQVLYVWFPKGKQTMVILDLLAHFGASGTGDEMFHAMLDYQRGDAPRAVTVPSVPPVAPSLGTVPAAVETTVRPASVPTIGGNR